MNNASNIILLLFFSTMAATAQTKLSGRVTDEKGETMPGVNISIKGSYDGVSTDVNGHYQFVSEELGTKILVVTFIGFKTFEREVQLNGTPIRLDVAMKETINQLEAVTINAGAFTASDESRRTIFKALDIATTAGATADIAGALNTLPGTQKVGESGRLFVRGGEGNETKTFIDGMVVLDAYSVAAPNTPSRGRFLPFMFKGTSFSTGGYSAEYGQALSSALALDSKDKQEMTRTDIGLLSVGGDMAHTQVWNRSSLAGKIQYTDIRPYYGLINQRIDWKRPFTSMEGSSAFRQEIGEHGLLKAYGNFNSSSLAVYQHNIANPKQKALLDLKNDFGYINTFYKDALNDKWSIRGGLSYTYINNDADLEADNSNETEEGLHAKAVVEGEVSDHVSVKAGADVITRSYKQVLTSLSLPSALLLNFKETITAVFTEADVYASNRFVTRVGLRAEHNSMTKGASVDPRVSLGYKSGNDGQFSLAYGTFRQTPKNEWLKINTNLQQEKAQHYIANYQHVNDNKTFRVEVYYKKYSDLVKYTISNEVLSTNTGKGYAQGLELFWRDRKTIKNVDYWISYSYLNTKRDYLNYPIEAMPSFASAHNFSVVYKHFISKLKTQVGATYSFSSARPYNNPNEDAFMNGRTPAYHDLSINISYLPKPYLIVYFSCTNVLGRDNIFGYEYADTPDVNGTYASRAIKQPALNFVFLGVFITFSKDKGINQLPSL
jgi:CarboxypepD_reg-like domain/TonB-dependent Receptor Plug Domain